MSVDVAAFEDLASARRYVQRRRAVLALFTLALTSLVAFRVVRTVEHRQAVERCLSDPAPRAPMPGFVEIALPGPPSPSSFCEEATP